MSSQPNLPLQTEKKSAVEEARFGWLPPLPRVQRHPPVFASTPGIGDGRDEILYLKRKELPWPEI